MRIVTTLES